MKYKWSSYIFKGDANKVGKELRDIEKEEALTNKTVLDYARRNKDSELNKCFEWDDKIAGEKYRLVQASTLMCSISIVSEETQIETTRFLLNVKSENDGVRQFKSISKILENDNEYEQIKAKAKNEFINCKEKYEKTLKLEDLKKIIIDISKDL